tara:strand:- start:1661 stop:2122 length:462 start_codon:yes stop_codon:yes gene_type:complete
MSWESILKRIAECELCGRSRELTTEKVPGGYFDDSRKNKPMISNVAGIKEVCNSCAKKIHKFNLRNDPALEFSNVKGNWRAMSDYNPLETNRDKQIKQLELRIKYLKELKSISVDEQNELKDAQLKLLELVDEKSDDIDAGADKPFKISDRTN